MIIIILFCEQLRNQVLLRIPTVEIIIFKEDITESKLRGTRNEEIKRNGREK